MTPAAVPSHVVPSGVGWVEDRDEWSRPVVFVAPIPDGPVSVLREISAIIWLAAVEGDHPAVEEVALATGHPVEAIREDVERFLAELVERGLLRPAQD